MRLKRHAPYASRGPSGTDSSRRLGKRRELPAKRAVVRRKPSFGLAFPGDRRTDDNFRLAIATRASVPKARDSSLTPSVGVYFRVRVGTLEF